MITARKSPSANRGQPLRLPLALTLNRQEMESPQLRLLEMLQLPGVSRETSAVFTTLLHRCANDHNLSSYVLQCCDESLQTQNRGFNLQSVGVLLDSSACSCPLAGVLLRMELVGLVADALNSEATRWMSDFLLIAIGKRKHQHKMSPSHPFVRPEFPERCLPARRDLEELQDLHVRLRDGPYCSISGSSHSVVCSQLIPISDDIGRLSRFRELARVFFQAEVPSLSDAQLQSTENSLLLSLYWKDRLDRGRLLFRCIDGEFHVIPVSRDDSDALAEERQSNGLDGPTILQIHGGISSRSYPRLNPQLAWVHQVITTAWLATGIAARVINDIDHVDTMPKKMQSMEILGPQGFGSLLKHRLMLM